MLRYGVELAIGKHVHLILPLECVECNCVVDEWTECEVCIVHTHYRLASMQLFRERRVVGAIDDASEFDELLGRSKELMHSNVCALAGIVFW